MLSKIKAWAIAIFAFFGILAGVYLSGRKDGTSAEKLAKANESAKSIRRAREIENEVESMSDSSVRDAITYRVR